MILRNLKERVLIEARDANMMFGVAGWKASTQGSSGFNPGGEISRVVAHPTLLGDGELPEDSGLQGGRLGGLES